MREIKFRAWNIKHQKMAKVMSIFFDKDIVFFDIPAEGIEIDQKTRKVRKFSSQESWRLSGTEVMQYTGLKDKNDKEIYEGDIVKADMGNQGHYQFTGGIAEVEYYEGGFSPFSDNEDNIPYPNPDKSEVIGNIWENPELLT